MKLILSDDKDINGIPIYLAFRQSVDKHLHFSRAEVTLAIKSSWFVGSFIVWHVVCTILFWLIVTTEIMEFWTPPQTIVKTRLNFSKLTQ